MASTLLEEIFTNLMGKNRAVPKHRSYSNDSAKRIASEDSKYVPTWYDRLPNAYFTDFRMKVIDPDEEVGKKKKRRNPDYHEPKTITHGAFGESDEVFTSAEQARGRINHLTELTRRFELEKFGLPNRKSLNVPNLKPRKQRDV